MTSRADALRGRFTPRERALLKRLVDAEIRQRQEREEKQTAATKRRYFEQLAIKKSRASA